MKGGNEGGRWRVGASGGRHLRTPCPAALDRYLYVWTLCKKPPAHPEDGDHKCRETSRPRGEGTEYLQFSRENFPMRGREPAAEGLACSLAPYAGRVRKMLQP